MNLYKEYTSKPHSFLVIDTTPFASENTSYSVPNPLTKY